MERIEDKEAFRAELPTKKIEDARLLIAVLGAPLEKEHDGWRVTEETSIYLHDFSRRFWFNKKGGFAPSAAKNTDIF